MLRKPPRLTPASLAARRANALKSTGPRIARGKAWSSLNALRHGRRSGCLRDKIERKATLRRFISTRGQRSIFRRPLVAGEHAKKTSTPPKP